MFINSTSLNGNKYAKASFGLRISPDLYNPMNELCDRVFVAQKYMLKRMRRDVDEYRIYCPVKNRLKKSLDILQDALPVSNPTLYPYINKQGQAFLAINTAKGRKLLQQINVKKFHNCGDYDSLKLKLSDLESVAETLEKMSLIENLKVNISRFLGYFKLK